jgi:hypothetical protein
MNPSSPQPEASSPPGTAPTSPQLEASAPPRTPQAPPQPTTQETPLEPEQDSPPIQDSRNEASVNTRTFISIQQIILYSANPPFQDQAGSPPSSPFIVSDPSAE